MSSHDTDLIDFQVGSPDLPRAVLSNDHPIDENEPDNLIDSELPILEMKLQNAKEIAPRPYNTIDVEDILISIDDDDEEDEDEVDGVEELAETSLGLGEEELSRASRRDSEILMELCSGDSLSRSSSIDNLEALDILLKLDEILNDTLRECDRFLNGPSSEGGSEGNEESIEDCLLELDNYLKEYDTTETEPGSMESPVLSENLLQLVTKSPTQDGQVNEGYETTENNACDGASRPLSAFGFEELKRNHPHRVTVAVCGIERPALTRTIVRKSMGATRNPRSTNRVSCPGVDLEEIDWHSVREVARDVMLERQAHASGACCTGTVIVEPSRNEDNLDTNTGKKNKFYNFYFKFNYRSLHLIK